MKILLLLISACIHTTLLFSQSNVLELFPTKDNTIYSESDNSNGQGDYLYSGRPNNNSERRALIKFDISVLPENIIIDSVIFTLFPDRAKADASSTFQIYKLTSDWGEGSSNAGESSGAGTVASSLDATWKYKFFNNNTWTKNGGDFIDTISATFSTRINVTSYIKSSQLTKDVKNWYYNQDDNFGWIIIGETSQATRFISGNKTSNKPVLKIYYTTTTTNIDDSKSNFDCIISPCPFDNYLNIYATSNLSSCKIWTIDGQLKKDIKPSFSEQNLTIPTHELTSGIYIMKNRKQ